MIAVDTSALMSVLLDEPTAEACMRALGSAGPLAISAATLSEALIVASRRGAGLAMARLMDDLEPEVAIVTALVAREVSRVYTQWGKGFHRAGLNWGDCFAYQLAKERDCPLLFVGDDFAQTDVRRAI